MRLSSGAERSSSARAPIALVTSSMDGGGAQRAVAKLASGMAACGHDVDVVLGRAAGPYLSELSPDVRVVDLGARRFAGAVVPLARYLRETRPRAVFSALDYVNIATVLARALSGTGVPLVVSERNTLSQALARTGTLRARSMPVLMRWAYRRADAVAAVSEGVAEDLVRTCRLAPGSVHVLNNPVVTPDMVRLRQEPVSHPWLREGSLPVVLAVGRLVPQKDFGLLLEAFAMLRRSHAARLVILGEGASRADLERRAGELGVAEDVSLPGFCTNPYPAMAAADVFVLCSRWEGSPGVLIEAMACGAPVVATDCPSGPRQVLDGGRHGRLVPVGDATALRDGIVDALEGRLRPPSSEGWTPYEQATVVQAHLDLLGVNASCVG
ncbi:MAG: glycosyltransferase [Actinomycetota bacterium]|nr:glycosyltransferase [Actinomycetota bacterium]